eukprot:GCRY01000544.1.p1 GENE.GCRY01000544.1~~GCRY01000544.1.p1  ORF type:complete len:378 (-),score=61.12 GCRY01000544.1:883-2016(-)
MMFGIQHFGARVGFGSIFAFFFFIALFLRYSAPSFLVSSAFGECESEGCVAMSMVYRVMFAPFVFFLLHSIIFIHTEKHGDPRLYWQQGFWVLKFFLILVFVIVDFFLPQSLFVFFANISRYGAGAFLLIQILLLIDFAYEWNEAWVEKDERKYYAAILGCSGLLFMFGFALIGLLYHWFAGTACRTNTLYITLTLVAALVATSIALYLPHGALLPSGVTFAYTAYVTWSALSSCPDSTCNPFYHTHDTTADATWQVILGVAITAVALANSTGKAAIKSNRALGFEILQTEEGEDGSSEILPVPSYSIPFFHLIFALSAMYMTMLLTHWGFDDSDTKDLKIDTGYSSMYVKLISVWATAGLYIWSLLAPVFFPERFQ